MYVESSVNQITDWLLRKTSKKGVKQIFSLAALASDVGSVRAENQDRVVVARGVSASGDAYTIFALADGMGGMSDGAQCAAITLGEFIGAFQRGIKASSRVDPVPLMWAAVNEANQKVYKRYMGRGGSTLVVIVLMSTGVAYSLSVGDSRIYGYGQGKLISLSVDDTIAGQLGKPPAGMDQSRLLQFIGMGSDLEPHINELDCSGFEFLFLTSDGVHYLDKYVGLMDQLISNSFDLNICVKRLIEVAGWVGGHDNASIIMISLDSPLLFERPKYYLEMWDAFESVQLMLYEQPFRSDMPTYIPQIKEVGRLSEVGRLKDDISGLAAKARGRAPKKAIDKNIEKIKSSRSRSKKKADELGGSEEKPQFHMEFPTNEKE